MEKPSTPTSRADTSATDGRRRFLLGAATLAIGAAACLVPAVTGLVAFLNPLRRKGQSGEPIWLTSLDDLPDDGTPHKFPIIADRTDAWTRFPNEQIGAVFLRRVGNGAEALNVICPHAGCTVIYGEFEDEKKKKVKKFFCPCHQASFDLSGKCLEEDSDSPRPLDTLVVDQKRLLEQGEVWVVFQNFQTGKAEKVPAA